ncbi:MAG: DUF4974 domain-containing protein [Calditrichaeota bacterium]|nr:DUF4974 domain-containing protein [Calditrichota bacterium]
MTKSSAPNVEQWLADESFQRWITNTATAEENKRWSDWLQSDFRHQEIYREAIKLWKLAQFKPASVPDIDSEWENLQDRLNLNLPKTASVVNLSTNKQNSDRNLSLPKLWFRIGAVAAAIILVALVSFYLLEMKHPSRQAFQIASTDYGQRVRIALPEGTTVILNANSTLQYPTTWTKKTIRSFRLKGEAYFIVASLPKGKQHNFIVETKDGKVEVVGTRFAVCERGRGTRVAVEEGCVKVSVPGDTTKQFNSQTTNILLTSGHLLKFKRGDRSLTPKYENVDIYTSWWTDQLVFDKTPFENIITRLQDTYGIQIKITDKHLLKRTLSGSIENTNLQTIITALARALQVPVQRKGNVIIFGKS